ncbi:TlpA family protein disulfide reductase [Desulfurivibrio sp. D14AmB]|uniref:TlpA family protein disulfide reductase n=1 Tax=Desulfurivibrio sp. D14AmB TaxID=3374370 RepID=UPI00376ECC6B
MNSITPFNRLALLPALGLILLLLLLVAGIGCSDRKQQFTMVETMPAFALSSALDGSPIDSRDFQGQAMVITFFATWCAPCRQEVPTLIALQNKYADRNFTVLGISVDQGDTRTVRHFMTELGINYPVAMSDPDTPKSFGNVFGIPTSFLVDRQGNIVQRYDGYVDITVLERALQEVLG